MKKYVFVKRMEDGSIKEVEMLATSKEEIKKEFGFIAIVSEEKISHPTADALKRTVEFFDGKEVTFKSFYAKLDENKTN